MDPSKREIKPLDSVEEVLKWRAPSDGEQDDDQFTQYKRSQFYLPGDLWSKSDKSWETLVSLPLQRDGCSRPKTLVCHDMMGGYLQDRFLDGCDEDGYHFRHWANIDIFIYFSHHFVTIPPPGWISAAKTHGVQILGTIITEWDTGAEMLEEILSSPAKTAQFVTVCSRLASHYRFDGWLLNIENKVDPALVPSLRHLVGQLTAAVKKEVKDGLVLWYDSVTVEGNLSWQNELNSLNKPFFDLCDGIFLNYTWTCPDKDGEDGEVSLDNLANSISALDNDSRRTDIFVGVDVFGRGCIGGGGFQCCEPLKEIRSRGLSAAIFAPGWTYELPLREGTVATDWVPRENLFWRLLEPFLNFAGPNLECWRGRETRGLSGLARLTTSHCVFRTSFSLGRGLRCDPTTTSSTAAAWFNLKKMEYQPNLLRTNEGENNEQTVLGEATRRLELGGDVGYLCQPTDTDSFKLSQSLQLSVTAGQKITVPIFLVELELGKDEEILFILDVKTGKDKSIEDCCLQLKLGAESGQEIKPRVLTCEDLFEICSPENWDLQHIRDEDKKNEWERLAFLLALTEHKILHKIGLDISGGSSIYIGEFRIFKKIV